LRGLHGAVILAAGKIIAGRRNLKEEKMPDRILTSHAGSLPRPEDLTALNEQRAAGDFTEEPVYLGRLRTAVADVVARQRDTGIDVVNDGEYGHSMGMKA
jgi:5-methyltetrahydropteroyltriglutamate--homocysteine methyltransferase